MPAPVRRIVDLDSHLMFLPGQAEELFGDLAGWLLVAARDAVGDRSHEEVAALRAEHGRGVGVDRNWLALGACDAGERLEALDALGIEWQLVFPQATLPALLRPGPHADAVLHNYATFVTRWAAVDRHRLRAVVPVPMHDLVAGRVALRHALDAGAAAVEIAFGAPPAGRSPADPVWDPFWADLAEAHVPAVLHIGGAGFGAAMTGPAPALDPAWGDAPALRPAPPAGSVGLLDDLVAHHAAETFVGAMVLGGVFHRHPGLRVGIIELFAGWVPSWLETMDRVATAAPRYGVPRPVERPSDVVARQIRVTAHHGEDVAVLLDRHPAIGSLLAFATDYPHIEGGRRPVDHFAASLAGRHDAADRFFHGAAEELFA